MHLKKCFEGIAKLKFDDELEVLEMCSVSDEVIPLVRPISTVKARGQVDKWLAELEIQMRLSLRQQIDNALKVYLEIAICISKTTFHYLLNYFWINFVQSFVSFEIGIPIKRHSWKCGVVSNPSNPLQRFHYLDGKVRNCHKWFWRKGYVLLIFSDTKYQEYDNSKKSIMN